MTAADEIPIARRSLRILLVRVAVVTVAVIATLALVGGLLGVWSLRRPFPTYDGELPLAGLSAPVRVLRDDNGIPQIYAKTAEDLFRAQGYVHAQDRFWEMDFRRHVTSGRLAELFGADQAGTDALIRTLGWRQVAEAEWTMFSAETRRYLTAYAEGVNAWIGATGGPSANAGKGLHYQLLGLQNSGYEVAPWDPVDSIAWLKAMAWDMRANLDSEIERGLLLAAGLTREQIEPLFPDYPHEQHQPIVAGTHTNGNSGSGADVPAGKILPAELRGAAEPLAAMRDAVARVPMLLGTAWAGLGSNSWVVAGRHTATGKPMLANDPHLGVSLPGIFHQIGLHCDCGYRVSGFSFSGVPGVVIGHNKRIAWGFTNLGSDVTDLYLERVTGDRYKVDGQWRDLKVREETIKVAGGTDKTITVRHTHRGPLVSDVWKGLRELAPSAFDKIVEPDVARPADPATGEYAMSLAWTALAPGRTVEALFALNQADDWTEFRAAAQAFEVPAQNMIYADVDGNIGYQTPGRVPQRRSGDGSWPSPGVNSDADWQGFVDFDDLPHVFNPTDGMVITANQAVTGPEQGHFLTRDWGFGYRSARIRTLLDEAAVDGPLDAADMEHILGDSYHTFAPTLVPALLATPVGLRAPKSAALDLLRNWDFHQPTGGDDGTAQARSSAAAAYFNAVWRHLLVLTFDELPEAQKPYGGDRWFQVVTRFLAEPASPWWDRVGTDVVERRDDVLDTALSRAYQELVDTQGNNPQDWRWGKMHTLVLQDATFGSSGLGPVEALFNRGPVEVVGGADAVNATWWDASEGYEVTTAPAMRMVVDLADLENSRWIALAGVSGHPYHRNYLDQLELWRTGGMRPWRWDRATIEREAVDTLVLAPVP